MKISVITLFPSMIEGFFNNSILKRAQEMGLVEIELVDLRSFVNDVHKTVDDRPYGGGAGMVIMAEPVIKAIKKLNGFTILTSASGQKYTQEKAMVYSKKKHLVILAGHYEGVDERISPYINESVSIGDFVLTGGEIVAVAIADSVIRLLPGVLKKKDATVTESFITVPLKELMELVGTDVYLDFLLTVGCQHVMLLEHPHYTRPSELDGQSVPEVLLSGSHKKIRNWRMKESYKRTLQNRPDLLFKALQK